MAMTPLSTSTAYATAAQLLKYYDARVIGQKLSRTGITVGGAAILTDATVAEALLAASGQIEAAAEVGGRYKPADLAALAASTTAGAAMLRQLTCRIAYRIIDEAVGADVTAIDKTNQEQVDKTLDALKNGERVFPFQEVVDAGVIEATPLASTGTASSPASYGTTVDAARRFFGSRGRSCP